MASQADSDESQPETMFDRWQKEQQSWQRLVTEYVDKASTDEAFLTNLGNAMRGSLLANKPYPGTGAGSGAAATSEAERSELDEIVFAVRRLEGQLLDLTMAVERLAAGSTAAQATPSKGAGAAGTATRRASAKTTTTKRASATATATKRASATGTATKRASAKGTASSK